MAMRGPTAAKFKLTESQMKKLANARKNGTDVTLRLNKNMIGADGIPLALTGRLKSREWTSWHGQKCRGEHRGSGH